MASATAANAAVCSAGTYLDPTKWNTNDSAQYCVQCPAGSYCPGVPSEPSLESLLLGTPVGKYECQNLYNDSGTLSAATYSLAGAATCSICPEGYLKNTTAGKINQYYCERDITAGNYSYPSVDARYVRLRTDGNTYDNSTHVVEIMTYYFNYDYNYLSNATMTTGACSNSTRTCATDGDLGANIYAGTGAGNWLTWDMGSTKTITGLGIALYSFSQRTYKNVEIQVSTDGTNWTTVLSPTNIEVIPNHTTSANIIKLELARSGSCEAGTYMTGPYTAHSTYTYFCSVCGENSWSDAGASSCTRCRCVYAQNDLCFLNSGSNAADHAGQNSCQHTCPTGETITTAEPSGCMTCPDGYLCPMTVFRQKDLLVDNISTIEICPANSYCTAGVQTSCTNMRMSGGRSSGTAFANAPEGSSTSSQCYAAIQPGQYLTRGNTTYAVTNIEGDYYVPAAATYREIPFDYYALPETLEYCAIDAGYTVNATHSACVVAPEFTITTTSLSANTTFSFKISAEGIFNIDWGDGSEIKVINKSDTTNTTYSHTYTNAGKYSINMSGQATGYNTGTTTAAISFASNTNIAGISGSLGAIFGTLSSGTQPRFSQTFYNCTNLTGSIPSNLFSGISGAPASYMFYYTFYGTKLSGAIPSTLFSGISGAPASYMFAYTFANCTNLTQISSGLFGGISGAPATYMYYGTFRGCSGLTSLPSKLFGNLSGTPKNYMFAYTFYGCTNLTSIPADLFSGVSGAPASGMFVYTFYNCSKLTSIPAGLFSGISGAPANSMFSNTFYNCSKLTSIPAGLFSGISGAPANSMFYYTFYNCASLTGSIPDDLFGYIHGAPASYMFYGTFRGCSSLTGNIPTGMFSSLDGSPQPHMFAYTFYGCSGLTGTIPTRFFGGLSGSAANYMFYYTFYGCSKLTGYVDGDIFTVDAGSATNPYGSTFTGASKMDTVCPGGTHNVTKPSTAWTVAVCSPCASNEFSPGNVESCTTVSDGYYLTGCSDVYPYFCTGQSECEAGNYCEYGQKSSCADATCIFYPTTSDWGCRGLFTQSTGGASSANQCYASLQPGEYIAKDQMSYKVYKGTATAGHAVGGTSPRNVSIGDVRNNNLELPTACDAGTYAPAGSGVCSNVTSGYYTVDEDGNACSSVCAAQAQCQPGEYCVGGQKNLCADLECSTQNSYVDCGVFSNSPLGASSSNQCYASLQAGQYLDQAMGAYRIMDVPGGQYLDAAAAARTITYDIYRAIEKPSDCPAGSFCLAGIKNACPVGTYSATTGAAECTTAPAGTSVTGCLATDASGKNIQCTGTTICTGNTWSNAGATSCTACLTNYATAGSTAPDHAGEQSCKIHCDGGYYLKNANDKTCTAVGTGKWLAETYTSQGVAGVTPSSCASGLTTIGFGLGADEAGDCGRVLHTGDGKLYLRSVKKGSGPAMNVKIDGKVYYGNMSTENKFMSSGIGKSLRLKLNGVTYSVFDDSASVRQ